MKRAPSFARNLVTAALAACLASAACTMKNQEAPPLTGPSEFGTSITITVSPDVLTQDGASQSLVTITVRDQFGNPLPNLSLRAETFLDGTRVDFGTLSARNLVSDANGKATLVFTAPASPAGPGVDNNTTVQIVVTPVGTDFGNTLSRLATIRLVPVGVVVPRDGLQPNFTFAPEAPAEHEEVFFQSTSTAPFNNPIASYSWDFGDGRTGSGSNATHAYTSPGLFTVTLTITDFVGRSARTSKPITVGVGLGPTASFIVSPSDPTPNQPVSFNASASTAPAGRRIISYSWDFGDGSPIVDTGSSPRASKPAGYTREGTYSVTLVVTDEAGKTGSASQPVTVAFPDTGLKAKVPVIK
jgi:PKD repeat protein